MRNLAIISTDWHIDIGNVELSKNLIAQQIQFAKREGIKELICLGDVFENKKAQPELVLNSFKEILDMVQDAGLHLTSIAGNHDKTNPWAWSSYLVPFSDHPAFTLIESSRDIVTEDYILYFQSYIKEPIWVETLQDYLNRVFTDEYQNAIGASTVGKKLYLFSHQAMNGSKNNDGSKMVSSINQQLLLPFEKCFFGHYHNAQQPLPNAYHLGALKQKNFGEDSNKGFYVLQDLGEGVLDVEFHKLDFPEYSTLEVDASQMTPQIVSQIFEEAREATDSMVRLSITGTTDELKSLPMLKELRAAGVKIKTIDTIEKSSLDNNEKVQDYEKDETLVEAFREFCSEKGYSFDEGLEYLKIALC